MFQYKVYSDGMECFCSPVYSSERSARAAFHKRFGSGSRFWAVIINCLGYKFVAEKPEGSKSFRRCPEVVR